MAPTTAAAMIDPVVVAAQVTFRAVMDAMARPGRIQTISTTIDAPWPFTTATASIARALFDHDTPIWCDRAFADDDVARWLRFHTSAPQTTSRDQAAFALIDDIGALPPLDAFSFGTDDYPDRSTTLIVQVNSLGAGSAWRLSGPGIDGATTIRIDGRLDSLLNALAINATTFPRGIDVVLTAGDALLALPRTTHIQPMEA